MQIVRCALWILGMGATAVIGAGCARTVPPSNGSGQSQAISSLTISQPVAATSVGAGQFRLTTTTRTQYNDAQGGTAEITLPNQRNTPLRLMLQFGTPQSGTSSTQSTVPPSKPQTTDRATVSIVPTSKSNIVDTRAVLSVSDMEKKTGTMTSPTRESYSYKSTASIGMGKKPFHWELRDGVYPMGKPVLIGTIEGNPVTLTISP